jgi:hypothetical protein
VIQLESVFLSGYLPAIKAVNNAITVLRLHNIEAQVWGRLAAETGGIKGYYLKNLAARVHKYEVQAWKEYDLLLPITDYDAKVVVEHGAGGNEMLTVPVAVNIPAMQAQPRVEWSGYHIGAMDWLPNAEGIKWFLEEVWPLLHERFPDFKFSFAGRNMPEYFKQLSIPGVICEGEVQDANNFIKNKAILFVPLRSGGGLRVKIIEAMALGKLVISTSVGMQGIDATDGVHYLRADSPAAFIKALDRATTNHDETENICKNGMSFAIATYDKDIIMSKLINKLDILLQNSAT